MNFVEALDVRMEEIASACTRCGKYFQACPMTEPAGIKDAEPTKVLSGIVDIREERRRDLRGHLDLTGPRPEHMRLRLNGERHAPTSI